MKKKILKNQTKAKKPVKNNSLLEDIGRFSILPILLLIVLLTVILCDNHIREEIESYRVADVSSLSPLQPYPILRNVAVPEISAQAAIILDDASKVILYEKNPRLRFSMASTTKIMTALTAVDLFKPDDVLTIKTAPIEGTNVGFYRGEQLYFDDVLYAMLLPSGNDAAYAVADNAPGGLPQFVIQMNEKANELQLTDTHYGDPAGLLDDEDYTTAYDLARLASYVSKNPTVSRITGTKERIISSLDGRSTYVLENLNKLLGIDGVNGIKTGQTEGAGGVLVTSTLQNGHLFIIVVMKSEDRFYDTQQLLTFLSQNVTYFTPNIKIQ